MDVLLAAVAGEVLLAHIHVGTAADVLAGQSLGELGVGETTNLGHAHHVVKGFEVDALAVWVATHAALAPGHHADLVVLEVGLLHDDAHAVAQGQHLAVTGAGLLLLDLAGLGQVLNQRTRLHVIHPGGELCALSGVDGIQQLLLGGNHQTFLLRVEGEHDEVGVCAPNELLECHVDGLWR